MKVYNKDIWEGFDMENELQHFLTVEAQYTHGWRFPIDQLPEKYRRLMKHP